jgi:hypothetical protein
MRTGTWLDRVAGRNLGNVVTIEYDRLPGPASSKGYSGINISDDLNGSSHAWSPSLTLEARPEKLATPTTSCAGHATNVSSLTRCKKAMAMQLLTQRDCTYPEACDQDRDGFCHCRRHMCRGVRDLNAVGRGCVQDRLGKISSRGSRRTMATL